MIKTVVTCDKCGSTLSVQGTMTDKWLWRVARKHGWTMGKEHLCTVCRRKVRISGKDD